jgi:bifunctional isochorismate lyase / aryl carrier protein
MAGQKLVNRTDEWLKALESYRSRTRSLRHPLTSERSALLVIDMQRYFLDEESHAFLDDASLILPNILKLTRLYKDLGLPVIFTRHALLDGEEPGIMGTWWSDTLRDGDPMSEIVDELKPVDGKDVVRKTRYSAFVGTDLEERLRSKGVERVIVTGVMTHLCCESTARDAFMRDFGVFIVVDATSSGDDDLHLSSLRCLTDGFAVPVTTEEVLACAKR